MWNTSPSLAGFDSPGTPQGLVVFATVNTLLQTTSAAQPGSVLSFPGFWATAAVLGLTVTIAWGGCGCVPFWLNVQCCICMFHACRPTLSVWAMSFYCKSL